MNTTNPSAAANRVNATGSRPAAETTRAMQPSADSRAQTLQRLPRLTLHFPQTRAPSEQLHLAVTPTPTPGDYPPARHNRPTATYSGSGSVRVWGLSGGVGLMAGRGPAPKRSDQRRRQNVRQFELVAIPGAAVVAPTLGVEAHPMAGAWFAALEHGPEAQFYTPAMWQRARIVAVMLSRLLESARPSAQMWAALQTDMRGLLCDPAEMRRLGIEVQARISKPADVIDYRARLTGGSA